MNSAPATPRSGGAAPRSLFIGLAAFSLVFAWMNLWHIGRTDPWYRNGDMNAHNIIDALSLNAGFAPGPIDQPAATTKFLLALDFRVRNALGVLPVWQAKRFARSEEPLREYARLVRIGREHSRILVLSFVVICGAFIGHVTRRIEAACIAVTLLCGSSGLLFHGLVLRPELLALAMGGVVALYSGWLASRATTPGRRSFWLVLAGLALGLSLLAKLPALFYALLIPGWLFLAALLPVESGEPNPAAAPATTGTIALALMASLALLALAIVTAPRSELINPVALNRIRLMAVAVALLPLVVLVPLQSPVLQFLRARMLDGVTLAAGTMIAFALWFGLLTTILPFDSALSYMARILSLTFYPDPLVDLFTHPGASHRLEQISRFVRETPLLFATTTALTVSLCFIRGIPPRTRALVFTLYFQAAALVFILSKRLFFDQYSIFAQVPLLLCWPISLAALQQWWRERGPAPAQLWPQALALVAALALVLAFPFELRAKYRQYHDDGSLPVNDLTVTFFYDHDVHPPQFLAALKQRYPTREDFRAAIDTFLNNPANRY